MKNFKLSIFGILILLLAFTSCNNEDAIVDTQQNTEESESITTTLGRLSQQYDENGNVDQANNPAGNIVFDFCFDFVFPIDLSFNTGTTVTVNSLDELIDIYSSSTENLFINGIAFPFQVETYNENSNALEIETINNEDEFFSLLEDCNFDDIDDCSCTEEYDPVCVNVTDLDGETYTISYPNSCHAICDGFNEEDFSVECEENFDIGGSECFEFVYPISIILDEVDTVTVNSREELFNIIYGAYHIGLVFPLDIITEEDNTVAALTINSYNELEAIIEDCFGDDYGVIDCSIGDITNTLADYCWAIEFTDTNNEFSYNLNSDGTYQLQDIGGNSGGGVLTSGVWNVLAGNNTYYVTLNAELEEYNDEWVVTDCDSDLGYAYIEMQSLVYPQAYIYYVDCNDDGDDDNNYDCSTEQGASNILTECPWVFDNNGSTYSYLFYSDGTFVVNSENNMVTYGEWVFDMTNNGYVIGLFAESPNFDDTWAIYDCDEEMGLTLGSIDYPQAEIYSTDCD